MRLTSGNGAASLRHKKNPREMVRKLMKLTLGEPLLKKMYPTRKNHWSPIPENVYEAIYGKVFIFLNFSLSKSL